MAEKIKNIQKELEKYQDGLTNHYITQIEYEELTSLLSFELRQLAKKF